MVGYLASRPALKGFVRATSSFLQVARQLEVVARANGSDTARLAEAQGVVQHHDGVSGSSKQAVAFDYAQRMSVGIADAEAFVQRAVAALVTPPSLTAPVFDDCPLVNVSLCPSTSDSESASLVVVVWNGLGQARRELITIPVSHNNRYMQNGSARAIPYSILPAFNVSATDVAGEPFTLSFIADLPPLGFATYFLVRGEAKPATVPLARQPTNDPRRERAARRRRRERRAAAAPTIENEFWLVTFNSSSGLPVSITNTSSGEVQPFTVSLWWYQSYYDNDRSRSSGAYIFRPQQQYPHLVLTGPTALLSIPSAVAIVDPDDPSTNITAEARVTLSSWAQLTVRLVSGSPELFLDYSVGPIPIDDGLGKEVIVRYETAIDSGAEWWTDANGREMQRRVRNQRPSFNYTVTEPVASNYYPVNALTLIKDNRLALSVLPDRSHGCSSLASGSLELMLHRRLLHDDYYGVSEVLNETEMRADRTKRGLTIAGTHRLLLTPASTAFEVARPLQARVFSLPHVLFAQLPSTGARWAAQYNTTRSFLRAPLPSALDLISMQPWRNGSVLMRLAHRHGADEGAAVNGSVTVDVSRLFVWPVTRVEALSLTANAAAGARRKLEWRVQGETTSPTRPRGGLVNTSLTITAAEVHTLQLWFNRD